MPLPYPISSTQTDSKSPIDMDLMDSIRLNQEYLDTQSGVSASSGPLQFKVNGQLASLRNRLSEGRGKKIDGANITEAKSFTSAKLYNKKGGISGYHEVDIYRNIELNHPITSISSVFKSNTQSIGRIGSPLNTQSISRKTSIINTQSISFDKSSKSIRSISENDEYGIGSKLVTLVGSDLLDGDYMVGDYINISGTTNSTNDGDFLIRAVNIDGLPSILITGTGGAGQVSAGGSLQLYLMKYTYLSAVSLDFVEGEEVEFSGHTESGNNGKFLIYTSNFGGNNIIVKNIGVAQTTVNGSASCLRWVYAYSSALDTNNFSVGERGLFSAHTSGVNNGNLSIVGVNVSGNNLIIYNPDALSQAGATGTLNTNRWVFNVSMSAENVINAGDKIEAIGHSESSNNGTFAVVVVNRGGTNNIEIYNESGVVQTAIEGEVRTTKKLIGFDSDYSSFYEAGTSLVKLEGLSDFNDDVTQEFTVLLSNNVLYHNSIVIEAEGLSEQLLPSGRISLESRSIFIKKPRIDVVVTGFARNYQVDSTATFITEQIPAESVLTLDVLNIQDGFPEGLSLDLT